MSRKSWVIASLVGLMLQYSPVHARMTVRQQLGDIRNDMDSLLGGLADKAKQQLYPLHFAAAGGDQKQVLKILGRTPTKKLKRIMLNRKGYGGLTPLVLAIAGDHPRIVEILIRHGADVNLPLARKRNLFRPLHMCIAMIKDGENTLEIMKILIKNGADARAKTEDGMTALYMANEIAKSIPTPSEVIAAIRLLKEHDGTLYG